VGKGSTPCVATWLANDERVTGVGKVMKKLSIFWLKTDAGETILCADDGKPCSLISVKAATTIQPGTNLRTAHPEAERHVPTREVLELRCNKAVGQLGAIFKALRTTAPTRLIEMAQAMVKMATDTEFADTAVFVREMLKTRDIDREVEYELAQTCAAWNLLHHRVPINLRRALEDERDLHPDDAALGDEDDDGEELVLEDEDEVGRPDLGDNARSPANTFLTAQRQAAQPRAAGRAAARAMPLPRCVELNKKHPPQPRGPRPSFQSPSSPPRWGSSPSMRIVTTAATKWSTSAF
jgi:hypothetical protein